MSTQPVFPQADFSTRIDRLGPCKIPSPVSLRHFVADSRRIVYDMDEERLKTRASEKQRLVSFEEAGPREQVYFDPRETTAAIVTCGGLCPGLNDVIRSLFHTLHYVYRVGDIRGIRFGYAGLNPIVGWPMIDLNPDTVRDIHEDGGTYLGSSRGPQPVETMVDTLQKEGIDILFTIGGDGTLRGAQAIYEEITRRELPISVIGIPKTIDNDINLVSRTFGFDTAVSEAAESIRCVHTEAEAAVNGIGIVKLMGRHSGFIAASASIAQADTNFVLVPEVPFELDGPKGFLAALQKRLKNRHHAVIVVAEGAGQNLFDKDTGTDASGNKRLGDIGLLLKEKIAAHFDKLDIGVTIKYIDPSYIIRSVPANPHDCVFCVFLAQQAVHAAMAGKTGMLVGNWNNRYVYIPIESATEKRKKINPEGMLWLSVLQSTGQPEKMTSS